MGENDLRWQLRQLPREMDPPHDLWPGIAARLESRRRPRRRPWLGGLALAASLVLAILAGLHLRPPAAEASPDLQTVLVQSQTEALVLEYEAALREFAGAPMPEELRPALDTLDASAREIRLALVEAPGEVHLLEQLRRTYARRLSLTQRAVLG